MAGFSRFGATQRAIFEALRELNDVPFAFLASGGLDRKLFRNISDARKARYRERMQRSVALLKRRRLIRVIERNGAEHITLTRSGKEVVSRYTFQGMKLPARKTWDGKWHLVIFDIPEKHSKARRALSYKLRQVGTFRLQDSVYAYPFPWRDEVDFISEFFHVGPYVRYLEVTRIEGEEELRRHFDL